MSHSTNSFQKKSESSKMLLQVSPWLLRRNNSSSEQRQTSNSNNHYLTTCTTATICCSNNKPSRVLVVTYLRRLALMLCILGLVLTLKMQSQVSQSIAQLSSSKSAIVPQSHPLLAGSITNAIDKTTRERQQQQSQILRDQKIDILAHGSMNHDHDSARTEELNNSNNNNSNNIHRTRTHLYNASNTNVPFVYMVFKRVDYLQRAMESLNKSDYPKDRLPVIISHDGRVPEVVQYVEKVVKQDFPHVIQLFHPYACYDHADSFPGNDTKLNDGYTGGDQYGNPRSPWATCCKHHFTWLLNQVFSMNLNLTASWNDNNNNNNNNNSTVDTFLFMEEDYIVAPTIYKAIIAGMNVMHDVENQTLDRGGFLGLVPDPTNGGIQASKKKHQGDQDWRADNFRTGPMTMHRSVFGALKSNAHAAYAYCTFDEYNWDFSLMHVASTKRYLPHTVLMPPIKLVHHIGKSGGMHSKEQDKKNQTSVVEELNTIWAGEGVVPNVTVVPPQKPGRGNGGWGHWADHKHCLELFQW